MYIEYSPSVATRISNSLGDKRYEKECPEHLRLVQARTGVTIPGGNCKGLFGN